jgi:hypothetical protein
MSRWAAEKAGFNSSMSNRIGSYADEPDDPENMSYDPDISGDDPDVPNVYIIPLINIPIYVEEIIESNYNHYYDPTLYLPDLVDPPNQPILQYILDYYFSPPYDGTGGAPNQISKYLQRAMTTSSPVNQRAINLSYASHFVCDMSMPFHTNDATLQAVLNKTELNYLIPEPHFLYENDYVGQNWTGGLKFGSVAENANYAYGTTNPVAHSKVLANYSHAYASTILFYVTFRDYDNRTLESVTDRCLFEGQAALNGLMVYGKNGGI